MALLFQPLLERHRPLLALLLLPMMVSPALMAVMYSLILNDCVGVIPRYLQLADVPPVDLFGPQWGFLTLVTIEVLQWTPFAFLVLYTALQAVPTEVIEAAQIDGVAAVAAGATLVGTTTSGYTTNSPQIEGPDFGLIHDLVREGIRPVAEGRYQNPEQARMALDLGAYAVVVGSAITRPEVVTAWFSQALRRTSTG